MNQIVQYVMIFGMVGVFFAALYEGALEDVSERTLSHRDRLDMYKMQAAERIVLVDFTGTTPAGIDVVNAGASARIKGVYVDGAAANYTIDGAGGRTDLPAGRLASIQTNTDGAAISLITESGRIFRFG